MMDKNTNMENLNKQLQIAIGKLLNKDYFKLEWGCKVKDIHLETIVTIFGVDGFYRYMLVSDTYNTLFLHSVEIQKEEDYEILGQEPTPDEILKALPHGWMMKHCKGTDNIEFINMENFGKKYFKNQYFIWYGFEKTPDSTKVSLLELLK